MSPEAPHLWIAGEVAAGRARLAGPADISVNCHRRLRGPYSGTCVLLHAVVPVAMEHWPELVAQHQSCLLYAAPDLESVTGPAPAILTFSTPHEERTRFFGLGYVRAVSHGIVTFLREYARLRTSPAGKPLTVFFDSVHEADPTEQEFLELALRRIPPARLRLLVGTDGGELPGRLAAALSAHAQPVTAQPVTAQPGPAADAAASTASAPSTASDERLARAYIEADGTCDDPALLAAYQRSAPAWRAACHDARADALEATGDWSLRLGAIPYHREHGGDRAGKGCAALLAALEHCVAMGFYAALYDFGKRGIAVASPDSQQQEYCQFTAKMASAAIALGRPEEAERMFLGLRERYALPKVHMSTSYNLAMLYTRWYPAEGKDHDLAKGFCNNAIALATGEPDPRERAFYTVFQRNGLALVEMHRGHLDEALRLVSEGMQRLDRELPAGKYVVHRWQLMHNRARVLVALGRLDEAMADFGRLVDGDPNYTEYYIDRGNTARKNGDEATALADYTRACELGIPFPEVYYNRGDMLAADGAITEAVRDFSYVLDMEPDHLDARIGHAELLIDSGDLGAAAASLAEGLARHPGDAALHTLDGLAALLTGDTTGARDRLDTALSLDPGLAAAWAHRAVLAAATGDPGLAVSDFSRALDLVGDDPDLRYQRGLAHLALGNQAAAQADLRAAASAEGEHAADARAKLAALACQAADAPAG
jgi:tetratricopeptide (TPR) repeat protein